MKYIDNSKTIDKSHDFLIFIARNYTKLALIEVCKQVDSDTRSESIINLLKDVKINNHLFTFKWFNKPYPRKMNNNSINDFKKFCTLSNRVISATMLNKDIKGIMKTIKGERYGKKRISVKSLCKFRNKRGAHMDKGNPEIDISINDISKAINLLEKIILKYNVLFTGGGMKTLLPANIDDLLKLDKVFKM